MKVTRIIFGMTLTACLAMAPTQEAGAVIPIAKIIKEGVKKVIKAVDLMIQRLQNKTIWLQNAQKVLENKLNELKLKEIAEWTEKHRKLYKLVDEYKRVWGIVQRDEHFSKSELEYMYRVYTGILNQSIRNLDQIMVVVNSFKTQMSDAKRLEIIETCGEDIERNYYDLKEFNTQNIQLSLSRAKDEHEIETVKRMYGLQIE
jgi:uncharacterized membrane protein YgaE (UPF0421/DUF939 family)